MALANIALFLHGQHDSADWCMTRYHQIGTMGLSSALMMSLVDDDKHAFADDGGSFGQAGGASRATSPDLASANDLISNACDQSTSFPQRPT